MPEGWVAFWRPDIGSFDGHVLHKCMSRFIKSVRTLQPVEGLVVLFFDACFSYLMSSAIEEARRAPIALVSLPAQT